MATMIAARIAMTVWIAGSGIGKGVVMSGYSGFQRGGGQIEAQTQMADEDQPHNQSSGQPVVTAATGRDPGR